MERFADQSARQTGRLYGLIRNTGVTIFNGTGRLEPLGYSLCHIIMGNISGTRGDVAKHPILAAIVNDTLSKGALRFSYAESHAGYSEYTLPRAGEWREGIGRMCESPPYQWPESLHPYRDACQLNRPRVGDRYPGSSGLVFRLVRHAVQAINFELYDINAAACFDLALHFPHSVAKVRREDGIAGLREFSPNPEDHSLVLIDPPDLESSASILALLKALTDKEIPFLCWTPRQPRLFKGGGDESSPSVEFFERTPNYCRWRFRWAEAWNQRGMKGCQITASKQLESIIDPVVTDLVKMMPGWRLDPKTSD